MFTLHFCSLQIFHLVLNLYIRQIYLSICLFSRKSDISIWKFQWTWFHYLEFMHRKRASGDLCSASGLNSPFLNASCFIRMCYKWLYVSVNCITCMFNRFDILFLHLKLLISLNLSYKLYITLELSSVKHKSVFIGSHIVFLGNKHEYNLCHLNNEVHVFFLFYGIF